LCIVLYFKYSTDIHLRSVHSCFQFAIKFYVQNYTCDRTTVAVRYRGCYSGLEVLASGLLDC